MNPGERRFSHECGQLDLTQRRRARRGGSGVRLGGPMVYFSGFSASLRDTAFSLSLLGARGYGRAPSQSLGVALSAVLLARSSLRGAAPIAHAECASIMNRKILWAIPVLLVVGLIIKNWSWSVSREDVIGTYVNTNYSHVPCCVEAPHEPDTLRLLSNGTMSSGFYGKGTWELDSQDNSVDWSYPYEHGMAGYSAGIDNRLGEPLKLTLEYNWGHHYRKTE